jgi:hypothetical protein
MRSSLWRYIEEALAETIAQVSINGVRQFFVGIRSPIKNGYMYLRKGGGFAEKLFKHKKGKEFRLDKAAVLAIARDAAAGYPNCEALSIVSLEERSGNLIWVVRSATVGRTLHVYIEDVSGKVVEIKESGVR